MKLSEIKNIIEELVNEELKEVNYTTDDSGKPTIAVGAPGSLARYAAKHPTIFKTGEMEGPYTVYVKTGRLAGQTVFAHKRKSDGLYYYLNPNTGHDEYIGNEGNLSIQKEQEQNEGVGYVYAKDRAKDPKSIKTKGGGTEHWRIKFQSTSDLKKHGNTEKSKVNEASYDTFVKGKSGDLAGKTPTDEGELKDMIANMNPGQSILFYGQSGIRGPMINITRLSEKDSYEVEDEKKKKQKINNYTQIDHLAKIIAQKSNILSRTWVKNQPLPPQTPTPTPNQITKEELKEVIKELINEMWVGWEENKQYQNYMDKYVGEECPNCKNRDISILNGSNPIVYQCKKCKHKWNPDHEKSTVLKETIPMHRISKPVRKPETNEWVVKWMTNGKRDENKTYYTDDEKDALDTYAVMVQHAEEENRAAGHGKNI